jgi:hypothetical protein
LKTSNAAHAVTASNTSYASKPRQASTTSNKQKHFKHLEQLEHRETHRSCPRGGHVHGASVGKSHACARSPFQQKRFFASGTWHLEAGIERGEAAKGTVRHGEPWTPRNTLKTSNTLSGTGGDSPQTERSTSVFETILECYVEGRMSSGKDWMNGYHIIA